MPREGVLLLERQPGLPTLLVEQAELDMLGDLAEQSEVGAVAVERGAQRIRPPGPNLPRALRQSWLRVWQHRHWHPNAGVEHVVGDRAGTRRHLDPERTAAHAQVRPPLAGVARRLAGHAAGPGGVGTG